MNTPRTHLNYVGVKFARELSYLFSCLHATTYNIIQKGGSHLKEMKEFVFYSCSCCCDSSLSSFEYFYPFLAQTGQHYQNSVKLFICCFCLTFTKDGRRKLNFSFLTVIKVAERYRWFVMEHFVVPNVLAICASLASAVQADLHSG